MSTFRLTSPGKSQVRRTCWLLLLGSYLALYPAEQSVERKLGAFREVADVLYLPSGQTVRRLSLGYEGLLADIYWTRVVQYFGRKRLSHAMRFELLGPLLRITTDLDPQLLVAYRFGSVFLAEKPPGGAGDPEEALQLIRRGIVANPDYWRLWQDLGFIYYWDLHDYARASRAFLAGSHRPGSFVWMEAMAATVAAQGGESRTSQLLWSEIYRSADEDQIRQSALEHLAALQAQEQIKRLNEILARYERARGQAARSFRELVVEGYLGALPRDSSGAPYVVAPDGRAVLSPGSKIDLRLLQ
jgi:hypothetical protein